MKFILAFILSSCAAAGDMDNFRQVVPGIYAGAQLTPKGYDKLVSLGVTKVIKLNYEFAQEEPQWALAHHMKLVYDPMPGFWEPSDDQVAMAVANLDPPVYVHCEHGADRTGLVIAIYRRLHGMSYQDSMDEWYLHGHSHWMVPINHYFEERYGPKH